MRERPIGSFPPLLFGLTQHGGMNSEMAECWMTAFPNTDIDRKATLPEDSAILGKDHWFERGKNPMK
jgi:hypothetical protein